MIKFESVQEGTSTVRIIHTKIPSEDKFGNADVLRTTERGWRENVLRKIRLVFGYGA